jgi:hypothetical protein
MVGRVKRVVVVEFIAVAALVAVVVFNTGLVHVVHSREFQRWPGIHICAKLKWTLGDTFMNLDVYVGQPERVAQLDGDALLDPLASLLSTW